MFKMRWSLGGLLAALVFLTGCGLQTGVPAPQPEPNPEPPRRDTTARDKKLREHHDTCVDLFGKTAGTGFERMIVIRHRPGNYPMSVELIEPVGPNGTEANGQVAPWGMTKHELIGLMNPGDVGAYPTNTLIHRLEKPKKRALDAFEGHALTKLRGGEEVVIEEVADGHLRVVGAVRLKATCLNCHNNPLGAEDQVAPAVKVGHLMGAFSYEFRRGVEAPRPPMNPPGVPIAPPVGVDGSARPGDR
jgi:hypothetical protein